MKSKILLIAITLLTIKASHSQTSNSVKLITFDKVPDEMTGCGNSCYYSEIDKKHGKYVYVDNGGFALIYVNGTPVKLKYFMSSKNKYVYTNKIYTLTIDHSSFKQQGDEYYVFTRLLTLKSADKILFQQKIVGDGGC